MKFIDLSSLTPAHPPQNSPPAARPFTNTNRFFQGGIARGAQTTIVLVELCSERLSNYLFSIEHALYGVLKFCCVIAIKTDDAAAHVCGVHVGQSKDPARR